MEQYKEMQEIFSTLDDNLRLFYLKGNAAAGTRARKCLRDLQKLAQDMRVDIQRTKSARKEKC